jgi:hypothetical protein
MISRSAFLCEHRQLRLILFVQTFGAQVFRQIARQWIQNRKDYGAKRTGSAFVLVRLTKNWGVIISELPEQTLHYF